MQKNCINILLTVPDKGFDRGQNEAAAKGRGMRILIRRT